MKLSRLELKRLTFVTTHMKTSPTLLLKEQQYHMSVFGHRFLTNKPVAYQGSSAVKPYNSLFYWSHGFARETSQFELHPHEGFEILSYVIEGSNDHYDTTTDQWTPLGPGDFQIIQAGSGVSHAERLNKGTRAFQIWFDPNFQTALKKAPAYADYLAANWPEQSHDGILIKDIVGGSSPAAMDTPGLKIQRWRAEELATFDFEVEAGYTYHFYVVHGEAVWKEEAEWNCPLNSSLRLESGAKGTWFFQPGTELFLIATLQEPGYRRIWEGR